jgi:hypothetical protein
MAIMGAMPVNPGIMQPNWTVVLSCFWPSTYPGSRVASEGSTVQSEYGTTLDQRANSQSFTADSIDVCSCEGAGRRVRH